MERFRPCQNVAKLAYRLLFFALIGFLLASCKLLISAGTGGNVYVGTESGSPCDPQCEIDLFTAAGEAYFAVADPDYAFDHWQGSWNGKPHTWITEFCTEDEGYICTVNSTTPTDYNTIDDMELSLQAIFVAVNGETEPSIPDVIESPSPTPAPAPAPVISPTPTVTPSNPPSVSPPPPPPVSPAPTMSPTPSPAWDIWLTIIVEGLDESDSIALQLDGEGYGERGNGHNVRHFYGTVGDGRSTSLIVTKTDPPGYTCLIEKPYPWNYGITCSKVVTVIPTPQPTAPPIAVGDGGFGIVVSGLNDGDSISLTLMVGDVTEVKSFHNGMAFFDAIVGTEQNYTVTKTDADDYYCTLSNASNLVINGGVDVVCTEE